MIRTSSSRNLRVVYSVLSVIISCLVLVSVWDASYIEDGTVEVSLREQYYDEVMAGAGHNYPVCGAIAALAAQLKLDEFNRVSEEKRYEKLLLSGQLHCGNVRVGMGIFDRRHNIPWRKCVPQIIPAKRRLLRFIQELCSAQQESNSKADIRRRVKPQPVTPKSSNHKSQDTSARTLYAAEGNVSGQHYTETSISASKTSRRGVVYTGTGNHFRDIYQSIYSLRLLNVSLPVEIWVNEKDHRMCSKIFSEISFPSYGSPVNSGGGNADVKCMKLQNSVRGFASKFYALLYTTFTDVLFMDADNVAVGDVNSIFDSKEYRDTGSILWSDLWGDKCRSKHAGHPGYSGFETHVLFVANFAGLKWENKREHAQEAETGQMAFDLTRHKGLLDFGRKFIEDEEFLKKIINGDKDIFRFAHIMTGQPFYYVPHFPGYSYSSNERDCLVHFFSPSPSPFTSTSTSSSPSATISSRGLTVNSSTVSLSRSLSSLIQTQTLDRPIPEVPMFFHQLKERNPEAFAHILRIPLRHRNAPSACLVLGAIPAEMQVLDKEFLSGNKDDRILRLTDSRKSRRRYDNGVHKEGGRRATSRRPMSVSSAANGSSAATPSSTSILMTSPIMSAEINDLSDLELELDKSLSGSNERRTFAKKLFADVDLIWSSGDYDRLIYVESYSLRSMFISFMLTIKKRQAECFSQLV